MKSAFFGLALLLPLACSIGSAGLSLSLGSEPFIADGTSQRLVTVCNTSDEPAANVSATLHASSGSWARASGADSQSIEVQLTSGAKCTDEVWLPPTQAGPARFEVQVGDTVEIRQNVTLLPAVVDDIAIRAAPARLSTSGSSSIEISIGFTTASGGEASEGTLVDVKVLESEPPDTATLEDGPIVVGKKDSLTLTAAPGTTGVRLQAKLKGSSGAVQTCRVLTQLGISTALSCG